MYGTKRFQSMKSMLYRRLAGDCSDENEAELTDDYMMNGNYPGSHPMVDEDLLSRWESRSLVDCEASSLQEHLIECPMCRRILVDTTNLGHFKLPQIFSREELG